MFYKMKMQASKPPSTALKAYGLMGLAKRNRDQGLFLDALKQWRRAEVMIVEAKMEYLADRAKRRKAWEKSEKVKEIERNERVRAMLDSELVLIPAGSFKMGSQNGGTDEMPVKDVKIDRFKMGETEVTFDLWEMCVDGGGCLFVPKDHGWGTGSQPVVGVSHRDIHMRFLPWLHKVTGKPYRLPTESEWEYAARAGSSSEYSWGDKIHCGRARYDGGPTSACNAYEVNRKGPVEVKSYKPNAFGLYDMHGNVWEWVADCWANTYKDTVVGGSARLAGNCKVRVLRGGSWDYSKNGLRSANRYYAHFKTRRSSVGFRLVLGVDDDK